MLKKKSGGSEHNGNKKPPVGSPYAHTVTVYNMYEFNNAYYRLWPTQSSWTAVPGGNFQIDTLSTPVDFANLVQLYVLYNSSTSDYYYTTNSTVASTYTSSYGYTSLSSPNTYYAWTSQPTGLSGGFTGVPIYTAYNTVTFIDAFGNYAQINSLGSAWAKSLTTPVFWVVS